MPSKRKEKMRKANFLSALRWFRHGKGVVEANTLSASSLVARTKALCTKTNMMPITWLVATYGEGAVLRVRGGAIVGTGD